MNKKTIIIGVLVGVAIIGGIYLYRKNKEKNKNVDSENKDVNTDSTQQAESTPTESTTKSKKDSSENTLNEVLKNTLGSGKLKTNDKNVKYVEWVVNDPNKKPYTWKFYPNQKFEVFDNKNVLTFSGSYRNGGLRQIISIDNYAYGTTDLKGITISDNKLSNISNKMFTLK